MSGLKRLGRVSRPKGLQALPNLAGKKKRRTEVAVTRLTLPKQPGKTDFENEVARLYGDDKLAARIVKLKQEYPSGTVPELVVLDYLRWKNIPFDYQAALYGGWGRSGGLVPDFILTGMYSYRALNVQGDYWHTRSTKMASDNAAKLRLIGAMWNGHKITSVVLIWEKNLRNRDTRMITLDKAVAGIEMPM